MSKVHQAIRRAEKENRGQSGSTILSEQSSAAVVFEDSAKRQARFETIANASSSQPLVPLVGPPIPENPRLVPMSAPKSYHSEQYRTLKTKLYQLRSRMALRSILVTSASASEGKTLTAVNLALTISQEIEQNVLLIDCDMRRPSAGVVLGFRESDGLADFLRQDMPSSKVILPTSIRNLYVITAGDIPENPAELLNTQKMKTLLASVSQQFDWVIIDSPPIGPLTDAELLSSFVDGTLLVVRARKTTTESLTNAVNSLKNGRVLGIVFNDSQLSTKSSYYNYYSYNSPKA